MQCKFVKTDGNLCEANAVTDSDFCFSHDPKYQQAKLVAVTLGGENRRHYEQYGNQLTIETPGDIKKLLTEVINGIWTGTIPANQPANSIGFLARCWLDAYELSELEKRIKTIEEKLEAHHM